MVVVGDKIRGRRRIRFEFFTKVIKVGYTFMGEVFLSNYELWNLHVLQRLTIK